jgi:hypothetical protein
MNKEKLLELAKECDYGITGYIHNGSNIEYEIWGGSMETHKLNKFADLIIKECAVFGMVATDDHFDVDALYKHFGVE